VKDPTVGKIAVIRDCDDVAKLYNSLERVGLLFLVGEEMETTNKK